jgi:hypothetical protein
VAGSSRRTTSVLGSGDERGLLTIRSNKVVVATRGKLRGYLRFPIFCAKKTGRTCAGTVKLRTVNLLNPATRGVRKSRRITFATFEYQLNEGKKGFAKTQLDPQKFLRMKQLRSVLVSASVQVTDADGNRQTIVRRVRMVTRPSL